MAHRFQFRNNDVVRHTYDYNNNTYLQEALFRDGSFFKIDGETGLLVPFPLTLKEFVRRSVQENTFSNDDMSDEALTRHLKRNVMVMTTELDMDGYTYWIRFTKRSPPSTTRDQETGQLVSSHPLHWRLSNTTRWPRVHYWLPPHEQEMDIKVDSNIFDVWTTSYGTYHADTNIVSYFDGFANREFTLHDFVQQHLANSGWGNQSYGDDFRSICFVRKPGKKKWSSMKHISIVQT